MLETLQSEKKRNDALLEKEKLDFINKIKKYKKEDIIMPKKPKLNLISRLKLLLWGN
jgi:hypothetical protein